MKSKKLVTSITHKLVGTSFYLCLLPPKLCKNGSTPRFWQLSPKSGWNLGHLRLNFAFHFSSESAKASGVHFAKMKMQERCGEGGKQPTKEAAKWKRRKNLKKKINLKKIKTVKMQERCGGGWKQPTRRSRLNILRLQSFSPNAIFLGQIWYEQSGKYGERASKKLTMLQDKKSGGAVRLWHRWTLVARERERERENRNLLQNLLQPGKRTWQELPL